ncbi:DUF742 domain-containing protein [Catenuloplanes atrovinosus]|uniref:DUF742 domain-containing protein n=1 Tax=Catenuloplanes atrovinosus TaxID=137266 RepID=A0AAE3YVD6_9ACTN|nr:DUF742 domain-containing protein [Catenuloplanes atrovinosus]MDR7280385.1 hypothetical protein [Catenuloplanes atrovinosus]
MSAGDLGPRVPDPRMVPPWHRTADELPRRRGQAAGAPEEPVRGGEDEGVIRPFLLTGGRTRPLRDGLRLETLIRAAPAALSAPLRFELLRIVRFCQEPRALADVATCLGVPVGVARVLVADLAADGYVTVDEPMPDSSALPIELIERIVDRVRAL